MRHHKKRYFWTSKMIARQTVLKLAKIPLAQIARIMKKRYPDISPRSVYKQDKKIGKIETREDARKAIEKWKKEREEWHNTNVAKGKKTAEERKGAFSLNPEERKRSWRKAGHASGRIVAAKMKSQKRGIFGLSRAQLQKQAKMRQMKWWEKHLGRIPTEEELPKLIAQRHRDLDNQSRKDKRRFPDYYAILDLSRKMKNKRIPFIRTAEAKGKFLSRLGTGLTPLEQSAAADFIGVLENRRLTLREIGRKHGASVSEVRVALKRAFSRIEITKLIVEDQKYW